MIVREPDGSLSLPTQKAITDELYSMLDDYSREQSPAKHREHLGASVIGDKCSRKLWYSFRWVKLEQHEPRIRRLFKRGHHEEEKFAAILAWMGFFIRSIDPETKRQYSFSNILGHYGGSGDSVALFPWFRDDENFRVLIEYKTSNKKYFLELKEKGIRIAKPQHFTQMCCYGKAFNLKYGIYIVLNKEDDAIYFEFVELDHNLAILMEKKASDVIYSKAPPPRLSDHPSYFECKYCHFNAICHYNEKAEVNCRSCKHANPIEDGQWHCSLYQATIPLDFIKVGCPQHTDITK